jgi:DNA-binding IclR family transcriptional regulator
MTLNHRDLLVLKALYTLALGDRHATLGRLAEATGFARPELVVCLARLDAGGYADSARIRLTLPGLALAVAAPRRRRRGEVRLAA